MRCSPGSLDRRVYNGSGPVAMSPLGRSRRDDQLATRPVRCTSTGNCARVHRLTTEGSTMADAGAARGMIAVDKMGGKVLFLDPATYETEVVLDGFPRTVHELLVVPETGLAYVPIFGDGIHGRNPNPGHLLCIIDVAKRARVGDIELRPYIAPHTLKLGCDGLIYMTCENSAVVAVIDRSTHEVVDAIDSGSTNGHRLIILLVSHPPNTENEEDGTVSVIDLPNRKLLRKIETPAPAGGHSDIGRRPHRGGGRRRAAGAVPDRHRKRSRCRQRAPRRRRRGRPDRPLQPGQQPDRRHQPQERYREPDRPVVSRADRDQGGQPADGHGIPRR